VKNAAEEAMNEPVHPEVRIGHVHLQVGVLQRATDFYHHVIGFDIAMYGPDKVGVDAAWLSAGDYHHYIALNAFHSAGGHPHRRGIPASTTSLSSTPVGGNWPRLSSAC
jgi:catechol 2,3-dioxygenase